MINALSIWRGSTTHTRVKPFRHHFRYPVAMIGLDLDRLDEARRQTRWLNVNARGLFSFHEADFGPGDGSSVKAWSLDRFRQAGIEGIEKIVLVCQPRILGYQFNPISLHYGYDATDELKGIIYEVHNTFGDSHAYVAPVEPGPAARHRTAKRFHVSPFFDVSGRYAFTLQRPNENLSLGIRKLDDEGKNFTAAMMLRRHVATDGAFARWFFTFPLSTLFTIAAIHVEALKLWIKGARYHSRPAPPEEPATHVLENPSWTD
ncbi:DUF1365 domain-containing protein [Hyphobacterium sp. HN65]|uniref:DUF1365 domain-containing protein n=1 Tax=Hyphobacterium lacteum TaxID=3116575 RepID=A0ABU7LM68_9PROT|nr:DUF1365 domain-containing protein [Hyphobacterium sp. HN65]MEE2524987.1 DUF1365 domain-containing protein [Hyphobacterium sp. HN65]